MSSSLEVFKVVFCFLCCALHTKYWTPKVLVHQTIGNVKAIFAILHFVAFMTVILVSYYRFITEFIFCMGLIPKPQFDYSCLFFAQEPGSNLPRKRMFSRVKLHFRDGSKTRKVFFDPPIGLCMLWRYSVNKNGSSKWKFLHTGRRKLVS